MAYDTVIDKTRYQAACKATADAIREKTGNTAKLTWDPDTGFKNAVNAISTGSTGITPTGTKTITMNGTHDVTSYAYAEVNVPTTGGDVVNGEDIEVGSLSELHAWNKYIASGTTTRTPQTKVHLGITKAGGSITIAYADAVDTGSGQLALSSDGYGTVVVSDTNDGNILKGKAVCTLGKYYEIPETANVWLDGNNTEGTYRNLYASEATEVTYTSGGDSFVCIVVSEDSNAYPQNGEQDGYKYVYNGTLESNSAVLKTLDVSPSTTPQTINPPTGYDGFSQVIVAGDTDLVASNIKKGVSIFNVTGTYESEPSLQNKSVTPSANNQVVVPDTAYDGLAQVTVAGDADLVASNIKKDVEIFGVTGTYEGAELPTLTTPGTASDLAKGKQLIDESGNVVTGTIAEYGNDGTKYGWAGATPYTLTTQAGIGLYVTVPNDILFRKGCQFALATDASNYGDATAADVVAGKTFTSAAGLKVVGTMSPISFTVTDDGAGNVAITSSAITDNNGNVVIA